MRAGFQKERAGDTVYNWTVKSEDILERTLRFYTDENGKVVYEIQ